MRVGVTLIFTYEDTKAQGVSVTCLRAEDSKWGSQGHYLRQAEFPEAGPSTTL